MGRLVRIAAIGAAGIAVLSAADFDIGVAAREPRDATRGGGNGPALPVQRGRESPLSIDAPQITIEVGQTAERDVGIAIGLQCDDLSILRAELYTETPESNVLRVTGVQPGDTRCRAGTVPGRPMFVFDIHVTARRTAPP